VKTQLLGAATGAWRP